MRKIDEKSLKVEESSKVPSSALAAKLRKILPTEDDIFTLPMWYLDTGNYGLNYICSGNLLKGYPSRDIVELFGDSSTGKTVLLMAAVAEIQRIGGIAVVNDVERRWDWDFAKVHHVDPDAVIKAYPETIEEFSVHTEALLKEILEQEPIPKVLFVLDSMAALSTEWEMASSGTKEDQGKRAKRIKALMRVIPKYIARAGALMLCANHIIDNPNVQYGERTYAPGGRGLKLQSSIRLEMQKPTLLKIDNKVRPYGAALHMRCVKNSVCPPFGETSVNVTWRDGIQRESGLLDIAIDLGIVEQSGGWYKYGGKSWRATDIKEMINECGLLQDPKWNNPYFLETKE